jgi:hypothetical protein
MWMSSQARKGTAFMAFAVASSLFAQERPLDWTHFVRTAGHGLNMKSVDAVSLDARETNLYGIEVDNDIPGRYESFLDPKEKLDALKLMAQKAHGVGNYAFVYIAGLECITANAPSTAHTFFKDHPDWVQRDLTGRPAVFGGGSAFWVREGDEDVWITPFAKEWRKIYMERVRQIAATGIDGVYVDIPYWMTHFDGWEDTWASFDDHTVEAFRQKTGLDARRDLKLGDFQNANFRRWIDFRIEALTDFMKEVNDNVKSINPHCKTIAEIYPGINQDAVRVGADVYDLYPVVDVIAHEFSSGGGNAAAKQPLDWFSYMAGMFSFRAFAQGKASWMLSYSWEKQPQVDRSQAMMNLFVAQLMAGTNCWDAQGHVMSGSNDLATRKLVYDWIAHHEKLFYHPRQTMSPIGLYFSPRTRDYFASAFISSYQGFFHLLLQSHREFQVVTPRTLSQFTGNILILPNAKCLSNAEISWLESFSRRGGKLVLTGEIGIYDETGAKRSGSVLESLTRLPLQELQITKKKRGQWIYSPECPGKKYSDELATSFDQAAWSGTWDNASFMASLLQFQSDLKDTLDYQPSIDIQASPFVATQVASVDGKPTIFLANFKGLKGKENPSQIPEKEVQVSLRETWFQKAFFLDFLGQAQPLNMKREKGQLSCILPSISKGAVIWFER